jgi:peptidoglycan/xylan/chitin deacetylase (PgdA/CDA1 family)
LKRIAILVVSLIVRGWDVVCSKMRRLARSRSASKGVVLYYHAVKPDQRQRFARQMDEVLKRASVFPADAPESISSEGWNVAVTFDDGFRSVVANAVPELSKRSIPFTVFVPSGCLGRRPSWVGNASHASWNETVLSAPELRALAAAPLATVGSHSVTHPNLLELAPLHSEEELVRSKEDLQQAAGVAIELFSFPHGAHSAGLLTQARRAGYRRVFTIEPTTLGRGPYPFAVGRVAADPDDWPVEFRLKIAGAYRWRSYVHRARQPRR